MNQGWIKLHRKLLDHPKSNDSDFMNLWITFLLLATHTPYRSNFGGKIITLKPGEFITSRGSLSKQTGIQESKVERIIKCLKTEQQIEQQKSNRSRLISVVNWGSYQENEQPNEQPVNNQRTTDEQPVNTNKNIKKEKKVKNEIINSDFESFRSVFPGVKNGYETEWKNFKKKYKSEFKEILPKLLPALNKEIEHKQFLAEIDAFCPSWKGLSTWLNKRCWEQELPKVEKPKSQIQHLQDDFMQELANQQKETNGTEQRNSNRNLRTIGYNPYIARKKN